MITQVIIAVKMTDWVHFLACWKEMCGGGRIGSIKDVNLLTCRSQVVLYSELQLSSDP